MSAHTPGPWKWLKDEKWESDVGGFVNASGLTVCRFGDSTDYYPTEGEAPNEADRALIAAAPDLLEAAKADEAGEQHFMGCDACKSGRNCEDGIWLMYHAGELRRAAIAKAEGK